MTLRFFVAGLPRPRGSKRPFALRNKDGAYTGRIAVADSNPRSREWMGLVADKAAAIMGRSTPSAGAVRLELTFEMQRPQQHYRGGKREKGLKADAPRYVVGKPDADKLARGTQDALSGILYHDDAQVVELSLRKVYAEHLPGVTVTLEELS